MTISTPVEWKTVMDITPSASTSTTSGSYVEGRLYIAFVTQFRTDSINPPAATASGLDATWTDITPNLGGLSEPGLWDDSSGSRRRMTVLKGIAGSSGTGALTVAYASNPANCGIIVWEFEGADNVAQFAEGAVSGAPGLNQEVTFAGAASNSNNVLVACVAANVNVAATARMELATDTSGDSTGDVDWTTGTVLTDTNPTTTYLSGYYTGDPDNDRDPSWYQNTDTPSAYMIALEIAAAAVVSQKAPYWGISWIAGAVVATTGLGSVALGTASLGQ